MKKDTKKLIKELEKICHDYIKQRDSDTQHKGTDMVGGNCIDCGKLSEGRNFQAGHFLPSGSSGALLRFHPENINGQSSGCNMAYSQERVKPFYTMAMIRKYGQERVEKIMQLKHKTVKADWMFYEILISLYKDGDEDAIIRFLEE